MNKRIKITAIIGEKLEKAELAGRAFHVSSPTPPEGPDVESQSHLLWHICPWCGAVGYSEESARSFEIFGCRCCDHMYILRPDHC